MPPVLEEEINRIFDLIKDSDDCVSLDTLVAKFNPEKHPRVKLMLKEVPQVQNEFDVAVKFILGDKKIATRQDFIDLHKNMFWVNPRENTVYFYRMIAGIWGC